jgi:hypothetical protein
MAIQWEAILNNSGVSLTGVDIGCSSGRPKEWYRLGSALTYVGIDPLVAEIQRLRNLNEPRSVYLAGFVEFLGAKGFADKETSDLFVRTSAAPQATKNFDSQKNIYNSGKKVVVSEQKYRVTDLSNYGNILKLDLLKIDIDSDDFLCLKAFDEAGSLKDILGLVIESQFHGKNSENGNTLWNIGKLANSNDLHLYDLSVNRYSRKCLPSKFIHSFPAQTKYGQALWGDALFLKDGLLNNFSSVEVVKLICIYEIYELFDCALEMLDLFQESINELIPTLLIKKSLIESHERREKSHQFSLKFSNKMKRFLRIVFK